MFIQLNGESYALPGTLNIRELVEQLGLDETRVAVEKNREIVPRSQFANTDLAAGDNIEIIHFVGGG